MHTVEGVGELGNTKIRVSNHWLYVRLCKRPDAGLIILCDSGAKNEIPWVEVLAIGEEVAKPRRMTKKLLKDNNLPRCAVEQYEIGDLLLCPDRHPWGQKRSAINWLDERFIDESVPLAIYRPVRKT